MTATHDLYDKVRQYLASEKPDLAVSLLQRIGWEWSEARQQVGAVAAQMRERRQAERERLEKVEKRQRSCNRKLTYGV
ncbi:MAG: hypothetical protein GX495_21405 [Chloroflexi bacterium]|nr:hypothetical protein [Chloroflexota bacterium]